MSDGDPRGLAIALVSLILLVFLHQQELGVREVRPLSLPKFL